MFWKGLLERLIIEYSYCPSYLETVLHVLMSLVDLHTLRSVVWFRQLIPFFGPLNI